MRRKVLAVAPASIKFVHVDARQGWRRQKEGERRRRRRSRENKMEWSHSPQWTSLRPREGAKDRTASPAGEAHAAERRSRKESGHDDQPGSGHLKGEIDTREGSRGWLVARGADAGKRRQQSPRPPPVRCSLTEATMRLLLTLLLSLSALAGVSLASEPSFKNLCSSCPLVPQSVGKFSDLPPSLPSRHRAL